MNGTQTSTPLLSPAPVHSSWWGCCLVWLQTSPSCSGHLRIRGVAHHPPCPQVGAAYSDSDQALSVSKSGRCPLSAGLRAPAVTFSTALGSGPWGPSQPAVLSSLCASPDLCLLGIWISVSDQRTNTWAPRVPRGLCPSQGERALRGLHTWELGWA